ncbi:MAG: hypothetical protein U0231_02025 [Nitrospiraceae bacterium]
MTDHDLDKLLGGFAADTLTPEERRKLYQAAIDDQQLFNALADEQALKELLIDPAVRQRLLETLRRPAPDERRSGLSWLDWFRRPAGLAFAGGLAAALFTLVFGTRLFEEGLKHSSQPAATEEARPTALPSSPPPAKQAAPEPEQALPGLAKGKAAAVKPEPRQELPREKPRKRERTQSTPRAEPPQAITPTPPQSVAGSSAERSTQDLAALKSTADRASDSATELKETAPAGNATLQPSAAAPAPSSGAPASPSIAGAPPRPSSLLAAAAPAQSARALFYSGQPSESDRSEHERKASKSQGFFGLGRSAAKPEMLPPLGLRYSIMTIETDGRQKEVDLSTAQPLRGPIRLTVEANQAAYIQVWKAVGDADPQLLLPDKETGKISLKLASEQREQVALSVESTPIRLTIRLSRVPFGPITRQEAVLLGRLATDQLTEAVSQAGPSGSQETATYVVNQDSSPTAQLRVEIQLTH